MAFKHGDIVVWKAQFAQSDEERTTPLVVLEPGDDGRCYVRPLIWEEEGRGPIAPTQMVRMRHLERYVA